MAIQKNITDNYGATHTAAYTRIRSVSFEVGIRADIEILVHHNAAARSKADAAAEKPPFMSHTFAVDGSDFATYFAETVLDDASKTLLTQAYAYVKTQATPINFTTGTTDV